MHSGGLACECGPSGAPAYTDATSARQSPGVPASRNRRYGLPGSRRPSSSALWKISGAWICGAWPRSGNSTSRACGMARRGRLSERRVVAQCGSDRWGGEVFADRRGVLVADHQQHRHRKLAQFVDHRLGVYHVVEQRRIPGDDGASGSAIQPGQHLHPALVGRLPGPGVIGRTLILAYSIGGGVQLLLVPSVRLCHGTPLAFQSSSPIGSTSTSSSTSRGIHQPVTDRQHPSG